jgi:hypothetical protein
LRHLDVGGCRSGISLGSFLEEHVESLSLVGVMGMVG